MNDDAQRLQEDVLNCFGQIAISLLKKRSDPYYLGEDVIKNNGTSRKKTLRLLKENGYLGSSKIEKRTSYGWDRKLYQIKKFDEESKALAEKGTYAVHYKDLYNILISYIDLVQDDIDGSLFFSTAGYILIDHLTPKAALHVYWYPDEYLFTTNHNGDTCVYPKDMLEQRRINTARCIVEYWFNVYFHSELEKRGELPADSLCKEKYIGITIRNFAHTPHHFNEKDIHGAGGFMEELDHHINYLKALRSRIQHYSDIAASVGGFDALIRVYRKKLIDQLISDSPLNAYREIEKDTSTIFHDNKSIWEVGGAKFLLTHMDIFDYDIMYGSDESVPYVINRCMQEDAAYSDFTPNEAQVALIQMVASTEEAIERPKELTYA